MSGNTKKFVTKNGLQTQNIDFVSNNESNTVTFSVSDEGILSVEGDIRLSNSLYDANNSTGNVGQILASTEDGIQWVNVGEVQGSSGFSGYSGISGFSGFSGISGFSGYSGASGFSGKSIDLNELNQEQSEAIVINSKVASLMPYLINENEKYLVPANTQALFNLPIEINGILEVDGILVQI